MVDSGFERQQALTRAARPFGKEDKRVSSVKRFQHVAERIFGPRPCSGALHKHTTENAVEEVAADRPAIPIIGSRDGTRFCAERTRKGRPKKNEIDVARMIREVNTLGR